jgi:alkanesulfonate monooxygenase SsuD/methylene tetrahydromethanopterin reductase-like flavin-dependent oxidoreductase (luciferase family)
MHLGLFFMPHAAPERTPKQVADFVLETIRVADGLGYHEAWIGEHFACGWEPVPSPDLLIAQALIQTKNIILAPGAHVLPYHHPVELAHRIAYLDHLAQGRYMVGIGAGSVPMDADLMGAVVYGEDGSETMMNAEMTREALDIMLKVWTEDKAFDYNGKFWKFRRRDYDDFEKGPFLKPFQKPHPPLAMTGMSVPSRTLMLAGKLGFRPMSFCMGSGYLAEHWIAYEAEATKAGHNVSRANWGVSPPFFVAETDEEAIRLASTGEIGRFWEEYMIPGILRRGLSGFVKADPSHSDDMIDTEYLARNVWLVGSPETVAKKAIALYEETGGFGSLLGMCFDFIDDMDAWLTNLDLMKNKVMPVLEAHVAARSNPALKVA